MVVRREDEGEEPVRQWFQGLDEDHDSRAVPRQETRFEGDKNEVPNAGTTQPQSRTEGTRTNPPGRDGANPRVPKQEQSPWEVLYTSRPLSIVPVATRAGNQTVSRGAKDGKLRTVEAGRHPLLNALDRADTRRLFFNQPQQPTEDDTTT